MPETDFEAYAAQLDESFPLREAAVRAAVHAFRPDAGSRGLDAGCGTGLVTLLLAAAVGPSGHVTGLDLSPELLDAAATAAHEAGLAATTSFQQGDVRRLPFDDHHFDWAWSMDCVGYMPLPPRPLLKELARVVRPGGRLALAAWSSERLLPGYPQLEAHLAATAAGLAPFAAGSPPDHHFLRGLGWFQALGLEEVAAQTVAGTAHAPLSERLYRALAGLLAMRWPGAEEELGPADRALFRQLCRPESPDFILKLPDYTASFTYTLFSGRIPV